MSLKHISGNLLDMADMGSFDFIIHGCNCFNIMGAGIAKQIADRYPKAKLVDDQTNRGDYIKIGNFTYAYVNKTNLGVINAYTQYSTSSMGEDVFEYEAFVVVLKKILHTFGPKRYGLPYIGMGLAGGDESLILSIIEEWASDVHIKGGSVTLVKFC